MGVESKAGQSNTELCVAFLNLERHLFSFLHLGKCTVPSGLQHTHSSLLPSLFVREPVCPMDGLQVNGFSFFSLRRQGDKRLNFYFLAGSRFDSERLHQGFY